MRKLSGFSLMEMMIVMLIVAVVAAASAPMINKKMLQDQANVSPWVWTGTGNSIAYNLNSSDTQAAVIGAITVPKTNNIAISKLHIVSDGTQLTLSKKTPPKHFHFRVTENAVHIIDDINKTGPNSVTIGSGASSSGPGNSVAIGMNANTKQFATAIGSEANASIPSATAIGYKAQAIGVASIAIGGGQTSNSVKTFTSATANGAIAIGQQAFSSATRAIAIGNSAKATTTGATALGSSAEAKRNNTTAIGYDAKANTNENTTALGSSSEAIGKNATAIGSNAKATIDSSIAIGYDAVVQQGKENSSGGIAIGSSVYVDPGCVGIGSSALPGSTGQKAVSIGEVSNSGKNAVAIGIDDCDGGYPGENGASCSPTYTSDYSVAIGAGVSTSGNNSIAIGRRTYTLNDNSIAIGAGASVSAEESVAIGAGATVKDGAKNAVAIGTGAVANYENEIVLGNSGSTVYIPGRLVVRGRTVLGLDNLDTFINIGNGEKPMALKTVRGGDDYFVPHTQWDVIKKEFNYEATSDRRLKNVGEAFKGGLAEIKKLEVFNYTFKKDPDKTPRVGVMAQDLEKIFPKAVFKGDDGFLRIRMEDMFYALVNAVKELDAKINLLEQKQKKIDELEKRVEKLEKRLEKLEKGK